MPSRDWRLLTFSLKAKRITQTVTAPDGAIFKHTATTHYPYTDVVLVKPRLDPQWSPFRWSHSREAATQVFLRESKHGGAWGEVAIISVNPQEAADV